MDTRAVRSLILCSILIVAGFGLTKSIRAANVTLAWDPSTSPDIASYILYYGTESGTYVGTVNVGPVLTGVISNLVVGTTYYFAVTAKNIAGEESAFSDEISYTPPIPVFNNPPTLNVLANLALLADAGPQVVALSGISSGSLLELQPLTVTASHDNPTLLGAILVTYVSPAPVGTLVLTPLPGATGSATVQVTVNDGSSVENSVTRTFTVTVNPGSGSGNTTNAILVEAESGDRVAPMVLSPDSAAWGGNAIVSEQAEEGLAFYGFWVPNAGNYRVWARLKSDTSAPGAFYAKLDGGVESIYSPSVEGSIPANWRWDLLKDWAAGAPWILNLSGGAHSLVIRTRDAGIWFDALYITSDPVFTPPTTPLDVQNVPPTLDPISNVVINANSLQQTINLTGITSGSLREWQLITISASSSNPSLIPTPTIVYGSPNSAGLLRFTPATNATGTAVVSVIVSDNQFTNATIERTFVVTVLAVNLPPVVTAGPDVTLELPFLLNLAGFAADDGQPNPPGDMTTIWSTVSGPGTVIFSAASSLSGTAAFSTPGDYVLRLSVSDGEYTVIDDLNVTVVDVTPPAVSGELLEAIDARSFTLQWQTDEPAICQVAVGLGANPDGPFQVDTTFTTIHRVSVSNLEPATLYYYRIESIDRFGNVSIGGSAPVYTPPVNIFAWAAEQGTLTSPMERGVEDSALDRQFITSPTPYSGSVSFPVNVGVLSTYRLWCRIWAASAGSLSFAVSADGAEEAIIGANQTEWKDGWIWVVASSQGFRPWDVLSPQGFALSSGLHQFVVGALEMPALLDELILSNDPEWTPAIQGTAPLLAASAVPVDRIHLTWTDNTSDEEGFRIEVWNGVNFTELATLPANITSFDDIGLPLGGTRYYRIYAFKDSDRTPYSSYATATLGLAPQAPTQLNADRRGQIMEITWTDNSNDEAGFVLEHSTDGVNFTALAIVGPNVTNTTDSSAGIRTNWYRVRAFNDWGSTTSEPVVVGHSK